MQILLFVAHFGLGFFAALLSCLSIWHLLATFIPRLRPDDVKSVGHALAGSFWFTTFAIALFATSQMWMGENGRSGFWWGAVLSGSSFSLMFTFIFCVTWKDLPRNQSN
jgi:hypothetical protein